MDALNQAQSHTGARGAGRRSRRGFTLLEAAMATVIIGVGVLALVEAQSTFLRSNEYSTSSATGTYLANEIRERMRKIPKYDPVNGLVINAGQLVGWGPRPWMTGVRDWNNMTCYSGAVFGSGGQPGPIDSAGRVVTNILPDGTVELDGSGNPVPLRGWKQMVTVEKVDPFNFNTVRANSYVRPAAGALTALAVDQFPLRITVRVTYQGPLDNAAQEVAKVSWIAP
jgi:type II secretory pathway pseudopilin PulG